MAVEDLGQKNHEIGSDPSLGFSCSNKAPTESNRGIRGAQRRIRPQGPAAARMDFSNRLMGGRIHADCPDQAQGTPGNHFQ